jgi:alkane 1-monooxygenase
MPIRSLKYLSPISFYTITILSFYRTGFFSWLPLIYSFVIIPILELLIKADSTNMSKAEEDLAKTNNWYDYMLYIIVPMQFISIYLFLVSFQQPNLSLLDILGRISAMGLLCGIFGINVGHELGHRVNVWEQRMAKALLLSSLYMHFFVEHNKGHHKNVATPDDPATSRLNEPIYFFFPRTIWYSFVSAWKIANAECRKRRNSSYDFKEKGKNIFKEKIEIIFSLKNEMVQIQIIQLLFCAIIGYFFGIQIMIYFMIAAFKGGLLLETVNYIEHYGLSRKRLESGNYERVLPVHSWNSDHVLGRLFLFELSRHSDHHYLASRKYQILKSHENAPQLPTGYPGSMLLSLVPPLWFWVMNKKIRALS